MMREKDNNDVDLRKIGTMIVEPRPWRTMTENEENALDMSLDYDYRLREQIINGEEIECNDADYILNMKKTLDKEEKQRKDAQRARRIVSGKASFWDKVSNFFRNSGNDLSY